MEATHIGETQDLIARVVEAHDKVVLWSSAGKDSTTLMHLAQPWASKITICSVIMDNGFPLVEETLVANCEAWGYTDVRLLVPPIDFQTYLDRFGWPVQMLHTSFDGNLQDPFGDPRYKASSWWLCSVLRVMLPLMTETQNVQADAVLTASRKSDAPGHERIGPMIEAHHLPIADFSRYDAIWPWQTAQVWEYIDMHQLALPPHYAWKRDMAGEAPDCRECSFNPTYLHWTKEHDPETYQRIMRGFGPVLQRLHGALTDHMAQWEGLLDKPQVSVIQGR